MPLPDWLQNLRAKVGHDLVMMTGTLAVVRNEAGEILLHLRTDVGFGDYPAVRLTPVKNLRRQLFGKCAKKPDWKCSRYA